MGELNPSISRKLSLVDLPSAVGQKGDQDSPTPTRVKLLRSKSATLIPGSHARPLNHHSTQTPSLPFSLIGLFPESQVLSNSPEVDVFLKLCESIIEFLAGLSCQTLNPLQIIPDQSDEAPLRQPSRTTTSAEVKDTQSSPETGGDTPESPQFFSHDYTQAVDMEGDQAERSACQALNLEGYWHSRRTRITKIMLTLTTWQDDFDQDELRQVFSGMSLLPEFNVEAAKQNLIGIGENLVQMVNITSANSRIGRRLREAGLTLKESVEMAKRSTSDPKNWNAASAISESSMTSNLDPGGDQDPVNILERDTQSLVAMDLAKSLRQKRLSRKHRVNEPTYEFTFDGSMHLKTDQSPHLITAASQAVQRQRITSPDRSRLQKDRVRRSSSHARRKLKTRQPSFHRSHQSPSPPLSRSSTAKDPGCPRSPKKARTGHVVNTQHNHLLVVEAALRSIGRLWLEAKPSSDIDSAINDGSAHLTLLISQDPKPFRMDSLERSGRSLPPEDLTQEAFTESVEDALSEAFRRLQLDDEAVRVAPELLKALRNQISETRGETMKLTPAMDVAIIQDTLSSMDFALSLLHNFPQWSIFTDSQSLAYTKSLCVSVESSLVDEYLNSLMRLFTESQKVLELKPDDPNLARNLLAFLFERARQLKSLDLSSSNSLSWEGLQEPLDDLLLQLESFPGTQAHALSRSSSIPNIEDHVTQMPMDENDQTTDQMSDEMSTNMITVQMYDDDEKTERQSSPVVRFSDAVTQILSNEKKHKREEISDDDVVYMDNVRDPLTAFFESYEPQISRYPRFYLLCIVSDTKPEASAASSNVMGLLRKLQALKEIEVGQLLQGSLNTGLFLQS